MKKLFLFLTLFAMAFATSCDNVTQDSTDDNGIVGTWYASQAYDGDGIYILIWELTSKNTFTETLTAYDSEGNEVEDDSDYDTGTYLYDSESSSLIFYFDAGSDAITTFIATLNDGVLSITNAGNSSVYADFTKEVISAPTAAN